MLEAVVLLVFPRVWAWLELSVCADGLFSDCVCPVFRTP